MISVEIDPRVRELAVALIEAADVVLADSEAELRSYADEVVQRTKADGLRGGEPRRTAVRQLLRCGGFKPSGRSKPAQEYLLRTVTDEGSLPSINNAVDIINVISLDSGLPISLVALDRLASRAVIRYGMAGEQFVFNRGGQEIGLEGLLCICAASPPHSTPIGSPVKDSVLGKVSEGDRQMLACIYAPRSALSPDELRSWAEQLGRAFVRWCGASRFERALVPEQW